MVGNAMSMLHDGRVIFTGTPDDIRSSQNPLVQQFISGDSAVEPVSEK